MTYLKLDADRLFSIADALNEVAATPLDLDQLAATGSRLARELVSANEATISFVRQPTPEETDGGHTAGSRFSLALEHDDRKLGVLDVIKNEGVDDADVATLRLLAASIAAHAAHAVEYAEVAMESRVDQMTGLGNRVAFDERLAWELSRASRYSEKLSLIVFDVDDFSRLNERLGRSECDSFLREVAAVLADGRAADSCFRIGSDEFALIMPNTARDGAEIAAIRMGWAVANLRPAGSGSTISAGVAQADVPDPKLFFAAAESALRTVQAGAGSDLAGTG